MVEHRLRRSRGVVLAPNRDQHSEDAVAAAHGALDDVAVVGRPGDNGDPLLERAELVYAAGAAHADHLVAAVQGMLHHVLPELPGKPDDADLEHRRAIRRGETARSVHGPVPKIVKSHPRERIALVTEVPSSNEASATQLMSRMSSLTPGTDRERNSPASLWSGRLRPRPFRAVRMALTARRRDPAGVADAAECAGVGDVVQVGVSQDRGGRCWVADLPGLEQCCGRVACSRRPCGPARTARPYGSTESSRMPTRSGAVCVRRQFRGQLYRRACRIDAS